MSDPQRPVFCPLHGQTASTFTCRHVSTGVACGFQASGDPQDPWPDAWCDRCDEMFRAARNESLDPDDSVPKLGLLCAGCYEAARDRNRWVPPLARGVDARLNDTEVDRLLRHAASHVDVLNDGVRQQWRWHDPDQFQYDATTGLITFDGSFRETLVADTQVVGSESNDVHTFQWSWSSMGPSHPQARAATMVRTYGESRGVRRFVEPVWTAEEDEAWRVAAGVAYLTGAQGLYRANFGETAWYLLLNNWRFAT